jgi:hypothetical protein
VLQDRSLISVLRTAISIDQAAMVICLPDCFETEMESTQVPVMNRGASHMLVDCSGSTVAIDTNSSLFLFPVQPLIYRGFLKSSVAVSRKIQFGTTNIRVFFRSHKSKKILTTPKNIMTFPRGGRIHL